MVEIGRVIHRRYLLQKLIQQGQVCAIYQASDQVLQRTVAVKVVPAVHLPAYRAALRRTSQFSHPNIVGTYDLIVEPETLYVVQERIDGDDFGTLLQTQLSAYHVVDLGVQVCKALLYAGSDSYKVCHGDLTPNVIMRDRRGFVRVNGFALPSDLTYFTNWSRAGGASADGPILSDRELPWGQLSEGRRADDTRALGLLLYQLLAGHPLGVTSIEPPLDGRLRFLRNVPAEICEIVARAIVRQHPQHINTVEALYAELKTLAETLGPPEEASLGDGYQVEDAVKPRPQVSSRLVTALPVREAAQAEPVLSTSRSDIDGRSVAAEPFLSAAPSAPTMADIPLNLAAARQAVYPEQDIQHSSRRLSLPALLLIGLIVFALFFAVGYIVANTVFAH